MKPAESAFADVPRGVALNENVHQTLRSKFIGAEGAGKQPSTIRMRLRFDDVGPRQLGRSKAHQFVQKKLWSICWVRIRYSSCLRRVKALYSKTSDVMSILLKSSKSWTAPRLASH